MPRTFRSLLAVLVSLVILSGAIAWQSASPPPIAAVKSGPRYFKGNLHTHSFWSDGDDFPEMIADWYKQHGYHFLTLTDHNVLSEGDRWISTIKAGALAMKKYETRFGAAWVETRNLNTKTPQVRLKPLAEFRSVLDEPGRFLLIPGEEITHRFAKRPVHMNAINLRDVITPSDGANVQETIAVNMRAVAEQRKKRGWKTIVFLNHPNFGWGINAEDMLTEELRYFEVYNGHPGVKNYGDASHASTERMWDILLALRLGKHKMPILYGMATDDAHAHHVISAAKSNPGRGWIMVNAKFLTAESLVTAIEAGDFYCSTGVTLKNVRRSKDELSLAIAAEPGVTYKTEFIATMKDAPLQGEPIADDFGGFLDVTRKYSSAIGKVVATSGSLEPSYRLTGNELYVRAKITSTKRHPNPYQKGDVEVAWTQPKTP